MWFEVIIRARLRSTGDEALGGGTKRRYGIVDCGEHIAQEQRQARQDVLHVVSGVGAIALAGARGKIDMVVGGSAEQRGDVVGQDLGGTVDGIFVDIFRAAPTRILN